MFCEWTYRITIINNVLTESGKSPVEIANIRLTFCRI